MNGNTIESLTNRLMQITMSPKTWFAICLHTVHAHLLCLCFARVKVDTPPESVNQEIARQTVKRWMPTEMVQSHIFYDNK